MSESRRSRSNSSGPSVKQRPRIRQRSRSLPPKVDAAVKKAEISREMLARRLPLTALASQPNGKIYADGDKIDGDGSHQLIGWKDGTDRLTTLVPIELFELFSIPKDAKDAKDADQATDDHFDRLSELWGRIEASQAAFSAENGVRSQVLVRVSTNEKAYAIERFNQTLVAVNKKRQDSYMELMEIEVTRTENDERILNFQVIERPRRPEDQSILDKIANGEVLIKSISRDPRDGRSVHSFTQQMKDRLRQDTGQDDRVVLDLLQNYRWAPFLHNLSNPRLGREAMRVTDDGERDKLLREIGEPAGIKGPATGTLKLNLRTGRSAPTQQKDISENEYNYTSKTATSLLPKSGRVSPYGEPKGTVTGLLFDLHRSDLRDEKYIFPSDAATDSRKWIFSPQKTQFSGALLEPEMAVDYLPLDRLKAREASEYNEVLAGLKPDGIVGVFYSSGDSDDLDMLHGIARRQLLKENGLAVPLVRLSVNNDAQIVSVSEQSEFLRQLLVEASGENEKRSAVFGQRKPRLMPWEPDEFDGDDVQKSWLTQLETLSRQLTDELEGNSSTIALSPGPKEPPTQP